MDMSGDFHIKFTGIDGESLSKDHKGEIEVLSWAWGLSSSVPAAGGGGGAGGRPRAEPFSFTHLYDKASPVLAAFAASGRRVKQAWVSARRGGEGQRDFLTVTMSDVSITDVHQHADEDGITETVSVSAGHVTFEYRPMSPDGSLEPAVKFDWDIGKNAVK